MLYTIKQNNRFGFINEDGEVIIKPEFDAVREFFYGHCVVKVKDKFGLISDNGNYVLQPDYSNLFIVSENLLSIKENGKQALMNFQGALLTDYNYDGIFNFSEGLALAYIGLKFSYIDKNGIKIIPFEFDFAESFCQGYAMVKKGKKFGLINNEGVFESEPSWDFYSSYENCYVVNIGGHIIDDDIYGGKFGIVSKSNQIATGVKFDFIGKFLNGEALIRNNGLFGRINEVGIITVAIEHKEPVEDKQKFRNFEVDKKKGLIDDEGAKIIPAIYDFLQVYPEAGFCWAKQNGLYGILSLDNSFIVKPMFELSTIYPIQKDYVKVELKNKKFGLLSIPSGDWLIPPEYDSIGVFKGALVELRVNKKLSYANRNGKVVWSE